MAEPATEIPKIISVRGGMSKEGLVRRLPDGMEKKSLDEAIKYATRSNQLKNDKERSIADAIKSEMGKGKYIIVLNGVDSVTADKIKNEVLDKYMQTQSRELENGERVEYGYAEIAVAGVQEGGYKTLEYRV